MSETKTKASKSSKAKAKAEASSGEAPKAEGKKPRKKSFAKFTSAAVMRNQIRFHERNPRTIDKHSFKKLRDFIRSHGLLSSVIVNRRRAAKGFVSDDEGVLVIVGGHQRVKAMDDLVDYPKAGAEAIYEVPIDIIEVDPAREAEILVALNNPGMQGQWDYDLLEQVLSIPDIDIAATGFDRTDLGLMFDEGVLDGIFGEAAAEQAAAEAPIIDALEEMRAVGKEADAADRQAQVSEAERREAELQKMRDLRESYVEKARDANEAEFLIVLVGDTAAEVDRFLVACGLPVDSRYVPLARVAEKLGIQSE